MEARGWPGLFCARAVPWDSLLRERTRYGPSIHELRALFPVQFNSRETNLRPRPPPPTTTSAACTARWNADSSTCIWVRGDSLQRTYGNECPRDRRRESTLRKRTRRAFQLRAYESRPDFRSRRRNEWGSPCDLGMVSLLGDRPMAGLSNAGLVG